jgi:hypothetical protein
LLKNKAAAKGAIASGVRKAFASLFKADENANLLATEALKGLLSQVSGADESMVDRSANTFLVLAKLADFGAAPPDGSENKRKDAQEDSDDDGDGTNDPKKKKQSLSASGPFRSEFHYNIQIHLPANGTEEAYLNIFNALRRTFK